MEEIDKSIKTIIEQIKTIDTGAIVKLFVLSFMELNFRLFRAIFKFMLATFKWLMHTIDNFVKKSKEKKNDKSKTPKPKPKPKPNKK